MNILLFFRFTKIISTVLSIVVIVINIYFVIQTVQTHIDTSDYYIYIAIGIFAYSYLAFCIYLSIHMAISMGASFLTNNRVRITHELF